MKPRSHKSITKMALEQYVDGRKSALSDALSSHRFSSALLRGTKDEDGLTYTRGTNWHFYPANDVIKNGAKTLCDFPKIVVKPTSVDIIEHRQERLFLSMEDGASEYLFEVFGRILHHIQDMSTPSHVVPIYHGPKLHDRYESFLKNCWEDIEQRVAERIVNVDDVSLEADEDFVSLYHSAAYRLLGYLASDDFSFPMACDGEERRGDSSLLWKPYNPAEPDAGGKVPFRIRGFGSFGPVGANFGVLTAMDLSGGTCYVSRETYVDIASTFVTSAANDTVRALCILERMVASDSQKRPFVEKRNPFLDADHKR